MNTEDDEFNRIEREATLRLKAVSSALKNHQDYLLKHMSGYERGVIEGMQMQAQSSVDRAVNALSKRKWIGLTDEEVSNLIDNEIGFNACCGWETEYTRAVEAKLKEKNEM
jgi:hypothetical protein